MEVLGSRLERRGCVESGEVRQSMVLKGSVGKKDLKMPATLLIEKSRVFVFKHIQYKNLKTFTYCTSKKRRTDGDKLYHSRLELKWKLALNYVLSC